MMTPSRSEAAEATPPNTGPNKNAGKAVKIPPKPTFMPDAPNSGSVNEKNLEIATKPMQMAVTAILIRFSFSLRVKKIHLTFRFQATNSSKER